MPEFQQLIDLNCWIVGDHLGYFSWSAIIWGDLMQNAMPVGIWHAKPPIIQMDTNGASWVKKYNLIIYAREYTLFNRKSIYISEGFYIVYLSTKEFSANIQICFAVDIFLDPPKLPTSWFVRINRVDLTYDLSSFTQLSVAPDPTIAPANWSNSKTPGRPNRWGKKQEDILGMKGTYIYGIWWRYYVKKTSYGMI